MPPLPQLRSDAINGLYEQLRFAPQAALTRDMARAEGLAGEIYSEQGYPEDWIVFRVTGYRPEIEDPALVAGDDLLWDLSALVERLSHDARVKEADLVGEFVSAADLCERWGVSRKTVDRFRKRGLVGRRVISHAGKSVLVFAMGSVEAFEKTSGVAVSRAQGFTRIGGAESDRLVRRARRYRSSLGMTLNEAALRLSQRCGRSHEGVRQLLLRHDGSADEPVFGPRPPRMDRRKALVLRAARLGIEPSEIAARIGRTTASVNRTLIEARADVLRGLPLIEPGADHDDPGSGEHGDMALAGETDLAALIERARATQPPDQNTECALARSRISLELAASGIVFILRGGNVSASNVDRAETMLRHESRLRAQLVGVQLGNIVRTVEDRLGHPVERLGAVELAALMAIAIDAAAHAAGSFDPGKGGRLAAPVGLSVSRAVSGWDRASDRPLRDGRATPVLRAGHRIPDFTRSVSPWQVFLEPDERVRRFLEAVDQPGRDVLALRFGLAGRRPTTAEQTAQKLGFAQTRIAPLTRAAIRQTLAASRGVSDGAIGKRQ